MEMVKAVLLRLVSTNRDINKCHLQTRKNTVTVYTLYILIDFEGLWFVIFILNKPQDQDHRPNPAISMQGVVMLE